MNTPTISGDALNGSRLENIRARDADASHLRSIDSIHDDGTEYFAPEKDRHTLLGLVDELTETLRQVADFWAGGDAPPELTDRINAVLAKVAQ